MIATDPIRLTEILIGIGVAIQAAESLWAHRVFSTEGLYDWTIISTLSPWMKFGWRARALNALLQHRGVVVMFSLQFACALMLISGIFARYAWLAVGLILVVHLLFMLRNQYGLDGSDQMMTIVLIALFIDLLHPSKAMQFITMGFIAAQLVLSYLTAGIAKAVSKTWRSGNAIGGILGTTSYGSRRLSRYFLDHQKAALLICWGVILYECGGPIALWMHPWAMISFVAIGAVLHFSIAAFMGLNIFFWSFVSAYPAVFFCAEQIRAIFSR